MVEETGKKGTPLKMERERKEIKRENQGRSCDVVFLGNK
jgi:hypothetical protein